MAINLQKRLEQAAKVAVTQAKQANIDTQEELRDRLYDSRDRVRRQQSEIANIDFNCRRFVARFANRK